jgi:ParB family chromosome partitioning protein
MAKRRSLGRGLDALLSQGVRPRPEGPTAPGAAPAPGAALPPAAAADSELRELPIDLLERGRYQPRVDMREESLQELADSIRAQGIVQPIVVRPLPNPAGRAERRYEIVAGERRWRAAQLAGLDAVPAVVRDLSDSETLAIALIENIQRENLNPIEEAVSLRRLVDEFEMTHADVADAVGRSRAAVSNLLRLLDLPPPVRKMLENRELDMGHARALLGLTSKDAQTELGRRAVQMGWSVRATEKAVRQANQQAEGKAAAKPAPGKDPDIQRLEQDLSEKLGARVELEHGGKGGRIVIRYNTLDELDGILEHIR